MLLEVCTRRYIHLAYCFVTTADDCMKPWVTDSFCVTKVGAGGALVLAKPSCLMCREACVVSKNWVLLCTIFLHVSATSQLRKLHWLPVKTRIQYKSACLCFQCFCHNTMPPYHSDLLHPYHPCRMLHSFDASLPTVPCFCLETFGKRSFSFFGPTV